MKSLVVAFSILALPAFGRAGDSVQFNRDVRPILADRCFHCHGPNQGGREANLRLDRAEGPEGAYRTLDGTQAIKPGSLADSEIWNRLTSQDDDRMPPPDSPKKPLSAEQKNIIRRWIEDGAPYADFWAFVPPVEPDLPNVGGGPWAKQAIDRLVLGRLKAEKMTPSGRADRRTLIRRLSLDLTGLPPTRDQIHAFQADTSTDAYERLVDRLLASPAYGEHLAKYWLDLVRFADTNGIHHDHFRNMTPYRDWVVRSFNQNLAYSDFVKFQLAGDLYDQPTRDQQIASGFNRLHLIIDRGTALPEESLARNVIDRVTAVGTAFLGLTVQCTVCHDHKYDPLTTKDFYQLYAFFNNLDGAPETGGRQGQDFERGLQPPYISLASESQTTRLSEFDRRIQEAQQRVATIEKQVAQAGKGDDEDVESKKRTAELQQTKQALEKLKSEKRTFERAIPVAMVMKERAEPRPAFILIRGAYDRPGERVERNTPDFLPPIKAHDGIKTRMDLAEWFVSPEHPLTARVAVNRFWQQLFGVGIVKTSEDFGAQGEWPSHPELLDYLAVSFVKSGWDVKALFKQIVMSETYRQASQSTPDRYDTDPENRLLSRGSRFRLDSEVIRDQILATSGLLNHEMFGRSVKPPQPEGLWLSVSMPSSYPRSYQADKGAEVYRRSIYTFWKRGMPPPQMTILDAPTREACIARRERTNTPLQSLLLMDEPEYLKAARHLARETLAQSPSNAADRLAAVYETITAQLPDDTETKTLLALLADLKVMYRAHTDQAQKLCEGAELPDHVGPAELAAWTVTVQAIYNLDVTKTRQ